MTRRYCFLAVLGLWLIFSMAALASADGGPHQSGPAPQLGKDLAARLQLPIFDQHFGDLPVASQGPTPILLKELWPALDASGQPEKLSRQLKAALDARLSGNGAASGPVKIYVDAKISNDRLLTVDVPLFSEMFAAVPVALVNEQPVTVAEFARDLQSVHDAMSGSDAASGANENIQRLMDRLITVRLIEQEARNIGFDQTASFKKQAEEFAEKTLLYALLNQNLEGRALDSEAVDQLYHQISLQGKFDNYRFKLEKDATALREAYEKGGDFDTLIAAAIAKKQAVAETHQGFLKFKDILPNIASAASEMEVGGVSQIFRQADGFMLFKLVDRQFVEDPQALAFARSNVWERQKAEFATQYINETVDRYTDINEEAKNALDFHRIKDANPEITLGAALQPLLKDQRILATVKGPEPVHLTVAELAQKIKDNYFHGVDIPLDANEVDVKKQEILDDTLFRIAGTFEAEKLGLDQTEQYRLEVAEFERRLLFDIFMAKVVTPEVVYGEETVQAFYEQHQADYMTPAMFKFQSLPFYKKADADAAADKLRSGSDFKWVSANSEGLVDVKNKDLLQFDRNILSRSSLPESLQKQATNVKRGDTLVYAEPDNYYYVLYFEEVYASKPRPYDQVRKELLQLVYEEKKAEALKEWVGKLKEAYETKVFLVAK